MAIRWKNNKEKQEKILQQAKIDSKFNSFMGGVIGVICVWIISCVVVYWYPNMFAATKKWELRVSQNAVKELNTYVIGQHMWDSGLATLLWSGVFFTVLLGFFLPFIKKLEIGKIIVNKIPLEAILAGLTFVFSEGMPAFPEWVAYFYKADCKYPLADNVPFFYNITDAGVVTIGWFVQIVTVFIFFDIIYVSVISVRQVFTLGPWTYFFRRTVIGFVLWKIALLMKTVWKLICKVYTDMLGSDMRDSYNWSITKIVFLNFCVLALISFFWWFGIPILFLYSVVIFYLIRSYIGKIQNGYITILEQVKAMNRGEMIKEQQLGDAGAFSYLQGELIALQNSVELAVEEKTKSQKMKTELITNVSHDLKTPLTAIITYVNLLKEEGITEEQRRQYIETLDKKSTRLKVLIEDLFEASKAASGNVEIQITKVNLGELVCQVYYEMADLLEGAGIEVKMHLPEKKVILDLDSQKTYRIFANLIGNIAKYGLSGTRAWIHFFEMEHEITVVIKNISATDLDGVTPESLTERFVRGDASRTTEGSGLGLAIAKSFTELQGGHMELAIDGDMFKAFVSFPKGNKEQTLLEEELFG